MTNGEGNQETEISFLLANSLQGAYDLRSACQVESGVIVVGANNK